MMPRPPVDYIPKRLSKKEPRLTFIVGMRCSDGLVLCADTLESDGCTKQYRPKLTAISVGEEWGICWGASGNAYTCDKFTDKLKESLKRNITEYHRGAIENEVEACLEFTRQSYQPQDGITIVVGMFGRPLEKPKDGSRAYLGTTEFNLYRGASNTGCISPVRDYCCAGMDVTLASFILSNTHDRFMPVTQGVRLGIFVTSVMKERADGVGGNTDCVDYEVGKSWNCLLDTETADIERRFPPSSLDETMARFWLNFNENRNLDELTRTHFNKIRANEPKQSAAQTSEDQP